MFSVKYSLMISLLLELLLLVLIRLFRFLTFDSFFVKKCNLMQQF